MIIGSILENGKCLCYSGFMASHPYDYSFALKKEIQRKTLFVILTFISLCIVIQLITLFVIFPVRVETTAMSPEYPENSLVFVAPYSPAKPLFFQRYHIQRGSVVYIEPLSENNASFFKRTLNYLVRFFTFQQASIIEPDNEISGVPSLRRVAGLPGDTLYMKDYVLYVRAAGETHFLTEFEVADRMYEISTDAVVHDFEIGVTGNFDEFTLGEDEYFLLADERSCSLDSRLYGPVKAERITGKALLRYFPFDAFGAL